MTSLLSFLVLLIFAFNDAALVQAGTGAKVEAKLIADKQGVEPGSKIQLGLSLQVESGWHVYWRNPGDTGLPTQIKWQSDGGLKISEFQWPIPKRFEIKNLVNLGYEGEVLLPMDAEVPASLRPGQELVLEAEAKWLVCKESCIPEKSRVSLRLPVVEGGARNSDVIGFFSQARLKLPVDGDSWSVKARLNSDGVLLEVRPQFGALKAGWTRDLEIFPEQRGLFQLNSNPEIKENADGTAEIRLRTQEGRTVPSSPGSLVFLAARATPWKVGASVERRGVRWVAALESALSSSNPSEDPHATSTSQVGPETSLAVILLFAFLGGLILNLMPCVFPVLFIKVLELVEDTRALKLRGWVYSLGVMCSFWFLAGAMVLLQVGGKQVGWGFQLQSPVFVAFLMGLFLLIGLNLLGTFEVATQLMSLGSKRTAANDSNSNGVVGAFATGVLSVVVASPCTAPFMGAALGFAFTQSGFVTFLVFSALGAGLAAPFLAISFFPGFVRLLPKPGAWMVIFKKALAYPMFMTVAWLIWVFEQQVGSAGLVRVLLALVLLSVSAWLYGDFVQMGRSAKSRNRGGVLATVFAVLALWGMTEAVLSRGMKSPWENFSTARVAELRSRGKAVFVDYTAAWCITCQANEQTALGPTVLAQLQAAGVALVRADWTLEDPEITASLASFGRSGVPLYVFYPRGGGKPQILPQLITSAMILGLAGS